MPNDLITNFAEIISIIEKAKAKIYKTVNNGLIDCMRRVRSTLRQIPYLNNIPRPSGRGMLICIGKSANT
jgi:hypothetical protein